MVFFAGDAPDTGLEGLGGLLGIGAGGAIDQWGQGVKQEQARQKIDEWIAEAKRTGDKNNLQYDLMGLGVAEEDRKKVGSYVKQYRDLLKSKGGTENDDGTITFSGDRGTTLVREAVEQIIGKDPHDSDRIKALLGNKPDINKIMEVASQVAGRQIQFEQLDHARTAQVLGDVKFTQEHNGLTPQAAAAWNAAWQQTLWNRENAPRQQNASWNTKEQSNWEAMRTAIYEGRYYNNERGSLASQLWGFAQLGFDVVDWGVAKPMKATASLLGANIKPTPYLDERQMAQADVANRMGNIADAVLVVRSIPTIFSTLRNLPTSLARTAEWLKTGEVAAGELSRIPGGSGGNWRFFDEMADATMPRQNNPVMCGSACGSDLLNGRGINVTQEVFGTTPTYADELAGVLNTMDPAANGRWFGATVEPSQESLQLLTRQGRFGAMLWEGPGAKIGHWVNVDGFDEAGRLLIRDPAGLRSGSSGSRYLMNQSDFLKHWTGDTVWLR